MSRTSTTVLVLVSPRMVQDALVRVMREIGCDHVRLRPRPRERFDAAVVIGELPAGITARVVLTLPADRLGASWSVGVDVNGRRRTTRVVEGLSGLMALLDRYVPTTHSRSEALDELYLPLRVRRSS